VLLFTAGGLILPRRSGGESLTEYFEHSGRYALLALAAFEAVAIPINARPGGYLSISQGLLYVLLPIALLVFGTRRRRVRAIGTVVFLSIYMFGIVFIWAAPGRG
jgi:hypothetical protein